MYKPRLSTILKFAALGGALLLASGHADVVFAKSSHKVHVITATGNDKKMPEWLAATDSLRHEIAQLAKKLKMEVWFHRYKSEATGKAPAILLECSDEFLVELRKLAAYREDRLLDDPKHPTERIS